MVTNANALKIQINLTLHVMYFSACTQNDLSEICGFADCALFARPLPPIACLTEVSSVSRAA